MPHPDHVVPGDTPEEMPRIEPVWPLTAGLGTWQLRRAVQAALASIPDLPEWHQATLMQRQGWPGFRDALHALHAPGALPDALPRARLAYDELLAHQVAMAWIRSR